MIFYSKTIFFHSDNNYIGKDITENETTNLIYNAINQKIEKRKNYKELEIEGSISFTENKEPDNESVTENSSPCEPCTVNIG